MSLTYGFYNSQSGDRVYSTSQLSQFLEGLITDGVFAPVNDGTHHGFQVVALPTPLMAVYVSVGKAWFNGTWTVIDAPYQVNLTAASPILNRIDAIVLTINKTRESRSNYIEVISGTPVSGDPEKPEVTGDIDIYRYVLGYVTVSAGVSAITDSAIENTIGFNDGIQFVDLESPLGENYPQPGDILLQYKTEFDEWFDHMKDQLDSDAAGHLQGEIDTRDDNLAEEYDSGETYSDGDFAMFDGILKKYAPSMGSWLQTSFAEEVKELYRLAYKVNGTPSYNLLYSNAGNNAFSAQQLPVTNYDEYDYIEIFYKINTDTNIVTSVKLYGTQTSDSDANARYSITYTAPITAMGTNKWSKYDYKRDIVFNKYTRYLYIDDAEFWRTTAAKGSDTTPTVGYYTMNDSPTLNTWLVPVKIYGVKINNI